MPMQVSWGMQLVPTELLCRVSFPLVWSWLCPFGERKGFEGLDLVRMDPRGAWLGFETRIR